MKKFKQNIIKIFISLAFLPLVAVAINNPGGIFPSFGDNSFATVLLRLINILLGIIGIITMAFIILGGFRYITSAGNEEQAEAGKKTITNAIIGLVIIILSYTIVTVIFNALQGNA